MKVGAINFYTFKSPNSTPFNGSPAALITKTIQKQGDLSLLNKFLINVSKWGEKETILLNGAGKALLAPLVILFNPFIGNVPPYKKENKAYMALKQPVSAAVNTGVQLGIFFGVNKGFDALLKKGVLAENFSNVKHLNILKGGASLILALATMPAACALANKIYSKVTNKFLKGKKYA